MKDFKLIKLVVSDLDGTLLNKQGEIEKDILDVIKRLNEKGILFTIATGRSITMATDILNSLKIEIPYILCNGAVVVHKENNIITKTMPLKIVRESLEDAMKMGMTVIYSIDGIDNILKQTVWSVNRKEDYLKNIKLRELEESEWDALETDKVFILNDERNNKISLIRDNKSVIEHCSVVQYGEKALEIVLKGVSKASGLETFISDFNIDFCDILAIGDQHNDIEMVAKAGYGVAVANAHDELKKHAHYVAKNECYLGVIEAIDKFCL